MRALVVGFVLVLFQNIPAIGAGTDTNDGAKGDLTKEYSRETRLILWKHMVGISEPNFDKEVSINWWESFVTTYTNRVHGAPNNIKASEYLRQELASAGYAVRIIKYPSNIGQLRVVEGIRKGMLHPNRYTGLVAHYDGYPGTTQAAYDDGSGVAITLSLCKLLAKVPTNKTIACIFFDAEEQGRIGSKAYIRERIARKETGFVFDHVFSYDMIGLSVPNKTHWKLYLLMGFEAPGLKAYLPRNLRFLRLITENLSKFGVNTDTIEIEGANHRRSDGKSFEHAGVPVLRFTGGRKASQYDAYHKPTDTIDRVYDLAGGRNSFEASFEQAVLISYYTILAYDHYDPKNLPSP